MDEENVMYEEQEEFNDNSTPASNDANYEQHNPFQEENLVEGEQHLFESNLELNAIMHNLKQKIEEKSNFTDSSDKLSEQSSFPQISETEILSESQTTVSKEVEIETLFENTQYNNEGEHKDISFLGASASQDQAFKNFKDYLNYHCNIRSYEIPHTRDLVKSSGDYDTYTISKLETWVRKMYADGKISGHDEDELFRYLRNMK